MLLNFSGKTIIPLIFGFFLINIIHTPPAIAGRAILNQTPQTIQKYFGKPLSKSVKNNGINHTYSNSKIRRLFPDFADSKFSIIFVNNKAKYIILNMSSNKNADDFTYDSEQASKFYEYIFGYKPPIWKQLSAKFTGNETIYDYVYCLGDGVATSFTLGGYKQFLLGDAILYYDNHCEPPYKLNKNL